MNMIDWLDKTATYMAKDRPDIYDSVDDAFRDLSDIFDKMNAENGPLVTSFASFVLFKWVDDDIVEFVLTRKISSGTVFPDEGVTQVFGYTKNSGTLAVGVDLPGPGDVEFD